MRRGPRSRLERVVCPLCGSTVGGYIPKDGDGSGLRPVWHKTNGEPCDGRFEIVTPETSALFNADEYPGTHAGVLAERERQRLAKGKTDDGA